MASLALELLYERDKGRCQYCGCEVTIGGHPIDCRDSQDYSFGATIDHIIPQSKGGATTLDNTLLACRSCNCRKKTSSLEAFRRRFTYDLLGIPRFDEEQREWLEAQGFEFPPNVKFYFEKGEVLADE